MADKIDRTMQRVIPLAYRVRRTGRRLVRGAAQAAQCLGGAEPAAVVDSGAGEFHQSRRRHHGGRDRLEPRLSALRLSGGGLLRAATVVSPGALRAAGPRCDGAKTRRCN